MVALFTLPFVVATIIAECLSEQDLGKFRLLCKTDNTFRRIYESRFFATRSVMLERNSLQNLIDISDSPTLRGAVRTLEIATQHLSREYYNRHLRQSETPSGSSVESDDDGLFMTGGLYEEDIGYIDSMREEAWEFCNKADRYRMSLREQEEFTSSGFDMAFLTRAMTQLPHCTKVCVSDAHLPWGLAYLVGRSGFEPRRGFDPDLQDSQAFVKHLIKTTMAAISASRIRAVEFDICLGLEQRKDTWAVGASVLGIPTDLSRLVQQSFTNVKNLKLAMSTRSKGYWDTNLLTFLFLFPNLSYFRLHLADRGIGMQFTELAEALRRSRIQVLELVNCSTTQENMLLLLLESSERTALKEFILRQVDIGAEGDWLSVLTTFRRKRKACSLVLHNCHDFHDSLESSTSR